MNIPVIRQNKSNSMKKKKKKKILSQILNGHRQLPGNNFISNLNSEKKNNFYILSLKLPKNNFLIQHKNCTELKSYKALFHIPLYRDNNNINKKIPPKWTIRKRIKKPVSSTIESRRIPRNKFKQAGEISVYWKL